MDPISLEMGWYLHRRYHRLHDGDAMMTSATSARRQPDLVTWGPGQSVHDFGAVGEVAMPQMHEKGKGSARPDAALQQQQQQHHQQHQHQHQHQPPQPPQPPPQQNPEKEKGSRRLKKVLLAGRG
ncbi:hypothetical protein MMC29_007138 [Sticta canariensis]|nr:hypothetical protein [Sticta canariensis]